MGKLLAVRGEAVQGCQKERRLQGTAHLDGCDAGWTMPFGRVTHPRLLRASATLPSELLSTRSSKGVPGHELSS